MLGGASRPPASYNYSRAGHRSTAAQAHTRLSASPDIPPSTTTPSICAIQHMDVGRSRRRAACWHSFFTDTNAHRCSVARVAGGAGFIRARGLSSHIVDLVLMCRTQAIERSFTLCKVHDCPPLLTDIQHPLNRTLFGQLIRPCSPLRMMPHPRARYRYTIRSSLYITRSLLCRSSPSARTLASSITLRPAETRSPDSGFPILVALRPPLPNNVSQ
jgi:hypothetical protein